MKQTLSLLLGALFFISFLLSGCSGREDENYLSSTSPNNADTESIASADLSRMDFAFSDRDLSAEYDSDNKTQIELSQSNIKITGNGAESKADGLYITREGTYILSGSLNDSMITVQAGEKDKVQLVFNNVSLQNRNGPAIYVKSADKVFITLADGSANSVSDGSSYTLADGDTNIDAAIFSRADLTLNGNGSLAVVGNCKHAVVSKDDLVISDAVLDITAQNVGLNGKDCVKINGGNINVTAGSDAIRSDNTEDANRGYIYIEGGTLNLIAQNDAVQAETALKLNNTDLSILAGGGSTTSFSSSSESSKGLKAGSDILISGGSYSISSLDDCIHSNNTICITAGTLTLSSGDDGIHADTDLAISGGDITITKSYEGIESSKIVVSGGNIAVTASDDGLNAAGGNDASGMGGRPGQGMFSSGVGEIIISGGYTVVDAKGDGIDSNGTISVTGGVTLVSGPTSNGNGSFDYDGSASVSGGVLIALGSSGMAQSFSTAENQGAIFYSFAAQNAGTSFALCDSSGKVVAAFTPAKAYQTVVITAPEIQSGNSYSIVAGGEVSGADSNGFAQNAAVSGGTTLAEIEMTSELYGASGHGTMMPGGGMGGPGGHGGGQGGFWR